MSAITLNPEQAQACAQLEGPCLVVAGAGSGKTRIIIERTARLIESGKALPGNLLIVTFTNKAADEIKQRIADRIGHEGELIVAGTFHSVLHRELLGRADTLAASFEDLDALGHQFGSHEILDEDAARKLLKEAIEECGAEVEVAEAAERMGLLRARGLTAEAYRGRAGPEEAGLVAAWTRYEERLAESNALDFDGILIAALRLLEEVPGVAEAFAAEFHYLAVDEFQDTNPVQGRILDRIMAGAAHDNLCAVGDEKQSIYGFRGSDIGIILSFRRQHPNATVINMNRNYRSQPGIIRAANACAAAMAERVTDGRLLAEAPHPALPCLVREDRNPWAEGERIARAVREQVRQGASLDQVAVLYRYRVAKDPIERAFLREGLPYVIVGDASFWRRSHIRDAMAFLTCITKPWATHATLRTVEGSASFGTSRKRLQSIAEAKGVSMTKAMEEVAAETGKAGPKQSARRMAAYLAHRDALRDLQATGYDPGELVAHAKRFWSIVMAPKWARREEGRHLKRVERDVDVLLGLLEERLRKGMAWDQAMDEMAFLSVAKRGEAPAVTLSTVHSAKGLEWDHVHYAGLNDLRERQRDDPDEREEERRVFYVGITRARKTLDLSLPLEQAPRPGAPPETGLMPSRFLQEVVDAGAARFADRQAPNRRHGTAAAPPAAQLQ